MGIRSGTVDLAKKVVAMAFTTTGATPSTGISPTFWPLSTDRRSSDGGDFNVSVYGTYTTATVVLEKTFDGGTTWLQANTAAGVAVSFTAPGTFRMTETEKGVGYRLRCSVYTTVTTLLGRISQ